VMRTGTSMARHNRRHSRYPYGGLIFDGTSPEPSFFRGAFSTLGSFKRE
jgi:hypothetical protein